MSEITINRNIVTRFVTSLRTAAIKSIIARLVRSASVLRSVAPYAAIEILLPGGSLLALGLWLIRRHKIRRQMLEPVSTVGGMSPG